MTDFSQGLTVKCHICGERFFEPEGRACNCWSCSNCKEWFSDHDMLANSELSLCIYCEDLRYESEMKDVGN
jgi:formylmethanofuran dehydrogenase subunit E